MSQRLWFAFISLLSLCAGLWYWSLPPLDPDLGWQLLGGEWVTKVGTAPERDFINSFRRSWHDYHWLGQVVLYHLYRWGGFQALEVLLGLLVAALFFGTLLFIPSNRRTNYVWNSLVLVGAGYLLREVVSIRPQMFALLGLEVSLILLVRRIPFRFELPVLLLIAVVLANVHVYWVFLPFLWGNYRIIPRLVGSRNQHNPWYLWGGFLLLSGAGLISPYGLWNRSGFIFENYALIWDYLAMPKVVRESVFEFQPTLAKLGLLQGVFLLWLITLARITAWRRVRADLPNTVVAFVGAVLAVVAVKYVAIAALFGLPFLVRHGPKIPLPHRGWRWSFAAIGCPALLFLALETGKGFPPPDGRVETLDQLLPISACRALTQMELIPRNGRSEIRVLTHFNHGGWCRWALHQARPDLPFRVTTDNRTQGIPGEHYQQSYDLFGFKGGWRETLAEWAPDAVVVGKGYALAQALSVAPHDWRLVYQDDVFAVFVPRAVRGPAS